jgi:hypothetical protein
MGCRHIKKGADCHLSALTTGLWWAPVTSVKIHMEYISGLRKIVFKTYGSYSRSDLGLSGIGQIDGALLTPCIARAVSGEPIISPSARTSARHPFVRAVESRKGQK